MKNKKKKKYSKLDSILEIPREVASSDVKITVFGFNEMIIENFKNILDYQENTVRINTFNGAMTIYGFDLKLEQMTDEDIKIIGKFDEIEFEEI